MADVHQLTRSDARRLAVRAQLLTRERPTDLLETVRRLSLVQLEPTSAVAPTADLVMWSRLGSSYRPEQLQDATDELSLVELHGMLRPAKDLALYRAEMAERETSDWLEDNSACRMDILERLRGDGPLRTRDLPDTCVRPWRSSGWNEGRNVTMMLQLLVRHGEVAAAGGRGRDRRWDLASRIYPDDSVVPADQALHRRDERRLGALGIARAKAPQNPAEPQHVGQAGEPAVVDGVPGEWRVDPTLLGQPFRGRAALLSPFDLLVQDRRRLDELFDFEYYLEMYKPAAQRRWGYYALPILYGDRLVGKLDARAVHEEGVLQVAAVHQDVPFTKAMTSAVDREIADLARWLDLVPVSTA